MGFYCGVLGGMKYDKELMATYGELDSMNTMHRQDILQRIDASIRCILISRHHTAPMTGHKASMSTYDELQSMNTIHYKEMCQQIDACLRCIAITEHQK